MGTATALIELGDRYWALGLPAAAKSVLSRALEATGEATPALRLSEIALAQGDARNARAYAAEAAKREPGPATKIVLGRAQLAAGELAAARMSLLAALDAPKLTLWDRARAHLELSRAAHAQADPGAGPHASAAFESALVATQQQPGEVDLLDEIAAAVVAHGRGPDASTSLDEVRGKPNVSLCAAALLAARLAAGDPGVTEVMVEDELAAAEAERPTAALRLRRLERRARRSADPSKLVPELDAIATSDELSAVDRARLHFLRAALCEENPATRDRAEESYRKGLTFQPGHTAAACKLALLVLDRGDQAGALAEIERALRIDSSHGLAWRNAARMLDAQSPSLGVVVGRLLDAAHPGAGSATGGVTPRLVTATAEVARHDVLAGVYAHGHRVKNLLGIIGARTRSVRKIAAADHDDKQRTLGELSEKLRELEKDVTALYEEWAQYLRSMQSPTPTVEVVPIAPLLHEVVISAQARMQSVPIVLDQAAGLPDLRGDRMLLREALLNVVSNAAEACGTTSGQVSVRVRAVASGASAGAPILEVVVADTGPGIPRAHLGRLFVPGFTTKETGSGVGLAIAERVVSAHHGRITVDSEEGRGTTITITLPTDKHGLATLPLWTNAEKHQ
ncbi:MAG: histidine kinase [Myxococcales bacterium]|nr:histidine kinase [Myxococcales bacterium]